MILQSRMDFDQKIPWYELLYAGPLCQEMGDYDEEQVSIRDRSC